MCAQPLVLTDKSFDGALEAAELPVVVVAWGAWCGESRRLMLRLDEILSALEGKAQVATLDIDEEPQTFERLRPAYLPAAILFHKGTLTDATDRDATPELLPGWVETRI